MITYVNTVLVGTGVGTIVPAVSTEVKTPALSSAVAGQYVIVDNNGVSIFDNNGGISTAIQHAHNAEAIKVGIVTSKKTINKKTGEKIPVVKWSPLIKKADLKSFSTTTYTADTEDTCVITFNNAALVAGKRIVVRLTFKDLPTRYRKWSESYEHVVETGKATAQDVVNAFVNIINVKGEKRARVVASNDSNTLKIVALPYDDDDVVDSISPAAKVRFTANAWYTDPAATGFDSKNKYSAATINKTPGKYYTASAKLVRDAEIQAMGYDGILNRGMGTWPIIKPEMNTNLSTHYDSITLEFENMYHAADDLNRKTKQTLQIFDETNKINSLRSVLKAFVTPYAFSADSGNTEFGTSDTTNNV